MIVCQLYHLHLIFPIFQFLFQHFMSEYPPTFLTQNSLIKYNRHFLRLAPASFPMPDSGGSSLPLTMFPVFKPWPVTFQAMLCGICGGWNAIGTGFPSITLEFSNQYQSSNAYLIYLTPTPGEVRNWQRWWETRNEMFTVVGQNQIFQRSQRYCKLVDRFTVRWLS
jgi:hypothetical protein